MAWVVYHTPKHSHETSVSAKRARVTAPIYMDILATKGAVHAVALLAEIRGTGTHIADVGFRTFLVLAAPGDGAHTSAHQGKGLDKLRALLHLVGKGGPERAVERRILWPLGAVEVDTSRVRVGLHTCVKVAVRVTSRVQLAPDWAVVCLRVDEIIKLGNLRVVLVKVHDFVRLGVDRVHTERRVQLDVGRDRRRHVRNRDGLVGRLTRRLVVTIVVEVEHLELVFVRVTEVDRTERLWSESADDLVEQVRRVRKSLGAVPTGKHVANDPHTLAVLLCLKQLVRQEAQHATKVWVRAVDVVVEVRHIPEVRVEGHDTQVLAGLHGEGTVVHLDILDGVVVDPAAVLPQFRDVVEVPVPLVLQVVWVPLRGSHAVERRRVVVTERGNERRVAQVVLQHVELRLLGVLDKVVAVPVRVVVGDQIAGEQRNVVAIVAPDVLERLHGAREQCPWRVALQASPVVGLVHDLVVSQCSVDKVVLELEEVDTVRAAALHSGAVRAVGLTTDKVARIQVQVRNVRDTQVVLRVVVLVRVLALVVPVIDDVLRCMALTTEPVVQEVFR